MSVKKILWITWLTVFSLEMGSICNAQTLSLSIDSIRNLISSKEKFITNHSNDWDGLASRLYLQDAYLLCGDTINAQKVYKDALLMAQTIFHDNPVDSEQYIRSKMVLNTYYFRHQKWAESYSLCSAMNQLIDNKTISVSTVGAEAYYYFCIYAARSLLYMNQPDKAIYYVEKGLRWKPESYLKTPINDLKFVNFNPVLLYTKAEIFEKCYHDSITAKKICEDLLKTYSDVTIKHYTFFDEFGQRKELRKVIKEKLEK